MSFFRITFFLFIFTLSGFLAQAQTDFKFGFRAGVNISTIFGPAELDDAGTALDRYSPAARIAVAASASYPFTDRMGMTLELAFLQTGATYRFESDNAYLKLPELGLFEGHQRIASYNITNGYIHVPLLFYFQPIKERLHIEFGPSVSFLINSTALGIIKYGVIDLDNPNAADFLEMEFDAKYLKDKPNELAIGSTIRGAKLDQTSVSYPSRLGGYYFFNEDNGPYYSRLDIGLNLGASIFLTKGLRIGTRVYYGLSDITNNAYDVQQSKVDDNKQFIFRTDRDINFGVQVFVGLQF